MDHTTQQNPLPTRLTPTEHLSRCTCGTWFVVSAEAIAHTKADYPSEPMSDEEAANYVVYCEPCIWGDEMPTLDPL